VGTLPPKVCADEGVSAGLPEPAAGCSCVVVLSLPPGGVTGAVVVPVAGRAGSCWPGAFAAGPAGRVTVVLSTVPSAVACSSLRAGLPAE
jgi:hypothetical protein